MLIEKVVPLVQSVSVDMSHIKGNGRLRIVTKMIEKLKTCSTVKTLSLERNKEDMDQEDDYSEEALMISSALKVNSSLTELNLVG